MAASASRVDIELEFSVYRPAGTRPHIAGAHRFSCWQRLFHQRCERFYPDGVTLFSECQRPRRIAQTTAQVSRIHPCSRTVSAEGRRQRTGDFPVAQDRPVERTSAAGKPPFRRKTHRSVGNPAVPVAVANALAAAITLLTSPSQVSVRCPVFPTRPRDGTKRTS